VINITEGSSVARIAGSPVPSGFVDLSKESHFLFEDPAAVAAGWFGSEWSFIAQPRITVKRVGPRTHVFPLSFDQSFAAVADE
jgi:hypothetical protein